VLCDLYLKRFDLTKGLLFDPFLMFVTNCLVVITQYWSSNYFHHQRIGKQNKQLQIECILE